MARNLDIAFDIYIYVCIGVCVCVFKGGITLKIFQDFVLMEEHL